MLRSIDEVEHAFSLWRETKSQDNATQNPLDRLTWSVYQSYLVTWNALQHQRFLEARGLAEQALGLAVALPCPFLELLIRNLFAQALFECGDVLAAQVQIQGSRRIAESIGSPTLLIQTACTAAYFQLKVNDQPDALSALKNTFELMRENGITHYLGWRHELMSLLCAVAFQYDIESTFVRLLVRHRRLHPPMNRAVVDAWPFPLKIYTLGRFVLVIDGQAVHLEGKSQKKPLDLLKYLIAAGGRDVAESRAADALWSEVEADQAHQNLKTTLHRLRKLVGAEMIDLRDGRLSLNAQHVWIDAWAFERLLGESRTHLAAGNDQAAIEAGNRAINLYHGAFIAADDSAFVWPLRERLRAKLLAQIGAFATSLCHTHACSESVALHRKALEIDPLMETFYQGLMRCHQCLQQPAEALLTYARCRTLLRTQLGIEPSPKTVEIEQSIRAENILAKAGPV